MKTRAILLLPLLLLSAAAGLLIWKPGEDPPARGTETAAATGREWESVDFTNVKPGEFLPGWDRVVGAFQMIRHEDRSVLEMGPDPMTEGTVLRTRIMHGGGGIRVRMLGERAKRSFPRFCVGLHGEAVYQLRANPGKKVLELVVGENLLASAPWQWRENAWLWLELRMSPGPAGQGEPGGELEGRAWAEGTERPPEPQVRHRSAAPPGMVRAALHGAPYAGKPILFDKIETASAASGFAP